MFNSFADNRSNINKGHVPVEIKRTAIFDVMEIYNQYVWVYFFGLFRTGSEHSMCPRSMKWFRTFWTNNMADKLTLLFLSAELEMDDDDDEMNLEESVVTAFCSHSCCFHVI